MFALTEDIDRWLSEQRTERSDNLKQELEKLRDALIRVMSENQMLRTKIIQLQQTQLQGQLPEQATLEVEKAARLVRDCSRASQVLAETIEMSKNLKMIRNGLKRTASTVDKSRGC